jgi:hypothetical protein
VDSPSLSTYIRSFFKDWISGMCGPISVPFTVLAVLVQTQYLKLLLAILAAICFLTASYRVWHNERLARLADGRDFQRKIDGLRQTFEHQIERLQGQILQLSRKPYNDALGRQGSDLIQRLSSNGQRLLRHLHQNEPLEVGRRMFIDVSDDEQAQQMGIAMQMGIVRHNEVRVGSGMLLRTDYVINPNYRAVLQDLLC